MNNESNFGFERTTNSEIEEYQKSMGVVPSPDVDIETLAPEMATKLAQEAKKLLEQKRWNGDSVSFVLTLTLAPGRVFDFAFDKMSLKLK